jgi:L,D-peptidoglycan transpeptidase YkuD (ErfK/YbiS/YcfS/YnhG family)
MTLSRRSLIRCSAAAFAAGFAPLSALAAGAAPQKASPWVRKLKAARGATQIVVVAAIGKTTAWVSMHEKGEDGRWREVMTTPGFIGKNGLGKTKEGDGKTPVGTFRFTRAFGLARNPGCAISYTHVNEHLYWSGDPRPGMRYNELVDIRRHPRLSKQDSEHLIEYPVHYKYALNISYNEKGEPGLGSAIFMHCFGPKWPYTGGCVALPEDKMLYVMRHVKPDCVVVIDSAEALGIA